MLSNFQLQNKAKGLCICGRDFPQIGKTKCKLCQENDKKWYIRHKLKILANSKVSWSKLKEEALDHYGRKCVCCGEYYYGFLVLDHINGGGTKERTQADKTYGRGSNYYKYLKNNGWPNHIQTLCANCNMAKGTKDRCPCPYSPVTTN